MILSPAVGPYMGAVVDEIKTVGRHHYRVIGYTAFNARGLIGSECHGIAILDEDKKEVIADEIGCGAIGYPALDPAALIRLHGAMMAQTAAEFRKTVNASRRLRRGI